MSRFRQSRTKRGRNSFCKRSIPSIILVIKYLSYISFFLLLCRNYSKNYIVNVNPLETPSDIPQPETQINIPPSDRTTDNLYSWLNEDRYGNIDETEYGMTDEYVREMILNVAPTSTNNASRKVLEQTICMEESRFLNWESDYMMSHVESDINILSSEEKFSDLVFRLMYLAIHEHQHRPAREEALARLSANDENKAIDLKKAGVGKFDFECPNAKYIVTNVPEFGLGASISKGAVDVLLLGVTSNRVALLMNSIEDGNKYFTRPWALASCPRRDMQCVFMPMSPCVLTKNDIRNAKELTSEELTEFRRTGKLDPEYEHEKVIIINSDTSSSKPIPNGFRRAIYNIVASLINIKENDVRETNHDMFATPIYDMTKETMELVEKNILDETVDRWRLDHAATFYILRPNVKSQSLIANTMKFVVPDGFDPQRAIGIPIRGSDKCRGESECFSFEKYMEIAKVIADEEADPIDTIVLTSESREILDARVDYDEDFNFPYRFIVNNEDATPGTGFVKELQSADLDAIMLSSIIAIKMQLLGSVTVGNCCSSFHKLMQAYNGRGCSTVRSHKFLCLQDMENEEYRLCCMWSRDKYCRTKKYGNRM